MQTQTPSTKRTLTAKATALLLVVLAVAASMVVLPQSAEAYPMEDRLEVTALSNGRFALDYYPASFPSNFGQIANYEVIDGNGMQVIGRNGVTVLPGLDAPAHHGMKTTRSYDDGRQVCFQVRAYSANNVTTNWSEKTCAWAPTYADPMNLKAEKYGILGGHSELTWEQPDFIPLGSVLVQPEWVQVYDGINARWIHLGNQSADSIIQSDHTRTGKYTCYTIRFWVSGLGVSDWSNWACLTLP